MSCVSCIKIDSGAQPYSLQIYFDHSLGLCGAYIHVFTPVVDSKNLGGCGVCAETFMHPAGGGYIGAQPRRNQPTAG